MHENIDEILKQAVQMSHDVDPDLLDRIKQSIGSNFKPVRPLPRAWVLTTGLILTCVGIAVLGAAHFGFNGFHKLSNLERALIFSVLALLIWIAATTSVSEIIPGSRHRVAPVYLLEGGCLALIATFAFLFRDYGTERFLSQGLVCLTAGLLHAIPTALASWWLLRRGYAVNPVAAGMAAGTLAGLAGMTMLELHCPNFEVMHVMLWHTAVVLVSGGLGALFGRLTSRSLSR